MSLFYLWLVLFTCIVIAANSECEVGFYGPGCKNKDNVVELTKAFSLYWHVAPSVKQPLTLEGTMVLRGYHCWAGIGLRQNPTALMHGSDFLIGQAVSPPVQEMHANTFSSDSWPLVNDNQSVISNSSAEFTVDGDTIYRYIKNN